MHTKKHPSISLLLRELRSFWATGARTHLPWRSRRDAYGVLVSEVMLQQTQAVRVEGYYRTFMRKFPTAQSLGRAPLREVLEAWQGLGYNRRARFLQEAAKALSEQGRKPLSTEFLETLSGVGPYTARATATFAYNRREVFIETNIRTVFLHHCFSARTVLAGKVADTEVLELVGEALKRTRMEPREFYWALMDYGAHLKKSGVRLNASSAHYAKQSKFKGSTRELRGAIVRELLKRSATPAALAKHLSRKEGEVLHTLELLVEEGMVSRRGKYFRVA